uniref:Putative ovule protein n=1 Tax=Solanum chacoense TaxID=4108 RepID=A0A0V0GQL8_SOLCH
MTFFKKKQGFDSNRSYERTKTSPTGIQMKTNYNNISSVISQVMSRKGIVYTNLTHTSSSR